MTPPVPLSAAVGRHRLGYDDYAVLPDDGRRYEILDGELAVSPAPRPWHQTVSRRLQFALYAQLELAGRGQVFDAPVDVILTPHDIVQPDLVVVLAEQAELVTERAIEGIPALLVEILSPSTRRRDLLVKSGVYLRCGVPRYWVVDPDVDRLECLVLRADRYEVEAAGSAPAHLEILGARIDLGAVFARKA